MQAADQSAAIVPFRGIRYDAARWPDLSPLIAPPYDIISPEMQEVLYGRHPNNFVRIELPRAEPSDSEQANRYTRAAQTLRDWLQEGVLVRDRAPCLYLLEQEFWLGERAWRRRGVFALVRLPEAGERRVLAHEGTLPSPRADRLCLMRACQAMTSPIMAISADPGSSLLRVLAEGRAAAGRGTVGRPSGESWATDDEGVQHRLWAISDRRLPEAIAATVGEGPLFIADGHHRFQTAVAFRDEMRAKVAAGLGQEVGSSPTEEAGFNYALMFIASARDPALKILPTHRLLSGLGRRGLANIRACMDSRHFRVTEAQLEDPADLPEGLWLEEPVAGSDRPPVCAVYFGDGRYHLLTPTDELTASWGALADEIPVNIVHSCLLTPSGQAGSCPPDAGRGDEVAPRLSYTTDARAAVSAVNCGQSELAILLRPTLVQHVLEMARAGQLMPGKSTYFYPKVPAGLVLSDASAAPV